MSSEMEILIKIIAIIGSVLGFRKLFSDISRNKKVDLREDFEFSLKFFNEKKKNGELSPILMEKGLKAVAGTKYLTASEIRYLIRLQNPTRNINRYEMARDILCFDEQKSGAKISYSKRYESRRTRIFMKSLFLLIYIISFSLVLFPLLFLRSIPKIGNVFTLILLAGFLLYFAWVSISKHLLITIAEEFIREQEFDKESVEF